MFILNLIVFVLILGTIIIIHELGHFIFARRAGILCHEFSIGMGPALYKKKRGETTFCIRAIPIGGYVSMAGEQVTEDTIKDGSEIGLNLKDGCVTEFILNPKMNSDVYGVVVSKELYSRHGEALEITLDNNGIIKTYPVLKDAFYVYDNGRLQITPYDRSFESKSVLQRFLTIFAGPFMNFVLAMIIYLLCYAISGVPNYGSTKIGEVSDKYPAVEILQKGDVIKKVKGNDGEWYTVSSWDDFSSRMDFLANLGTEEVTLVVDRNGNPIELEPIKNYIRINSIGLSNMAIADEYKNFSYSEGIMVGIVGLNYVKSPSSSTASISNGDILKAINIVNHGESYNEANWVNLTSWSQLMLLLKDTDVANIYFKFYDQQTSNVVSTKDTGNAVESYGNEVLSNQRIDKIDILIGISPVYHHNIFGIIKQAGKGFWSDFTLIFRTLKLLIAPSGVRQIGVDNLSGVVGIYSMIGSFMSAGILSLLLFMALLSVNIGVMNLLPIPALDGGRLVFLGYEGITKKPINRKVEAMINNIMFIILMLFFVYVTFNDITRLFK